jgi:hypothetical protein
MDMLNTALPQAGQVATHADAVWTAPDPGAGHCWVLDQIDYSYGGSSVVANGQLVIAWQDTPVGGSLTSYTETHYIGNANGRNTLEFPAPLKFPPGLSPTNLTVTLKDGGANVIGSVYPRGRTVSA